MSVIDVDITFSVNNKPWVPTIHSRICSVHFVNGIKSNDPRSESYNPTIFPSPYKRSKVPATSTKRALRAKCRRELNLEIEDTECVPPEKSIEMSTQTDPCDDLVDCPDSTTILFCWQNQAENEVATQTAISIKQPSPVGFKLVHHLSPKTKDTAVGPDSQMTSGFFGYLDVTTNTTMKQMGGINLSFFSILLEFIIPGKDGQPLYFKKLCKENRLLLFLMKMKLGLTFCAIGCLFHISGTTASKIFYDVLNTVLINTKSWVFWPSKEAIKETLPESFVNYPDCRAIIDCTELECDTPPTVEQRVLMYSNYKGRFTIKYLIAIAPCGMITFISKGYGGRATDGYITNDSGFLNLVVSGDVIMADKGFPIIKSELMQRNCTLVMPPFCFNPQFTEQEVNDGYAIASVRIHVERAIQRVKLFKILDHINAELFTRIDDIMYAACVLANNKEPLINKAK